MVEIKISETAKMMRGRLLTYADVPEAGQRASANANVAVETLNAANIDVATHILAQALLARAVVDIAAQWWSDMSGVPLPETYQAMLSLMTDVPIELIPTTYDTREGKPGC